MAGYRTHLSLAIHALATVALACGGCRGLYVPRIDPTGQRIFLCEEAPLIQDPNHVKPCHDSSITVTPCRVTAPIGSEVILQGTVCGQDGCMMANQRVEWSLDQGGVGHFVTFGQRSKLDHFGIGKDQTRKVDNTFVIAATQTHNVCLNRGTPTPDDDVRVSRGQSWVSVTSAVEGTSYVNAFADDVYGWDSRQSSAYIEWIDARWSFPPPAINPAGSRHVFTTTVIRQSTNLPITGWRVRYEITGGPEAGFAPTGAKVVEVSTDELGQARAEIMQAQPTSGTNTIAIQIIRPAELSPSRTQYIAAAGVTSKTWTTPEIFLRKTGPAEGSVGSTLTYRVEVRNPSDLTAREVVVSEDMPEGMVFLAANPAPAVAGNRLEWRLGDLRALDARSIDISFRAERPGTVQNCANVATADGLSARDCATTTILAPTIELSLNSPPSAVTGQDVAFVANITNRGATMATGLVVVARFDPALAHSRAASPIERPLEDLPPGASRVITVNLRAVQPGNPCVAIEVFGDQGVKASQTRCVQVAVGAVSTPPPFVPPPTTNTPPPVAPPVTPPTQPPAQPPAQPPPANTQTAELPRLTVRKTGAQRATVGDSVKFTLEVRNEGRGVANNVIVNDNYDRSFRATMATDGSEIVGGDLRWRIPTLAPGEARAFEVLVMCEAPGTACNRVTVTCDERQVADAEACVEVTPAPTKLSVSMVDLNDPVGVGGEANFEIKVTNNQNVSQQDVVVTVTLSPELRPKRIGTSGQTLYNINAQSVQFAPVRELRGGETISFRVRADAVRQGTANATVEVRGAGLPQPMTAATQTSVFAN